jgi:carboxyl-terminal processing protease
LDGLSSIDPAIDIASSESELTLTVDGREAGRFPSPPVDNLDSWGELTATAIEAVRASSNTLSEAESEQVYEAVFSGLVEELDDFSRYAGRDQARENRASRDGFGGVGVRIRVVDEGVKILSVMENTPAESAGLMDNDLITHINGEPAAGLSQREVVQRLRGPIRTRVTIVVQRAEEPAPLNISVTRAHIVPQTVKYRAEGDVGYIKIAGFNQNTAQTVREKLLQAERELGDNLKGFVLDLRDNPGGLLDQSVSVSDLFISRGRIVSTHGRHPDSHQFFDADQDDLTHGLPIVVLVNGNSASASEIVAAALQDSGRAVLIGSNSFGKGTVQTVLRLPNEGELTLTWARFHAPSGYALQKRGVLPDICTNEEVSSAAELLGKVRHGEFVISRKARTRSISPHDDAGLAELRARCPVSEEENKLDLQVALALLEDSSLFAQLLRGGVPETAERSAN